MSDEVFYSKIEWVKPKIYKGEHKTYVGSNSKKNWVFLIKMANGDEGEVSGLSEEYRFKSGTKISYQKKIDERSHNQTTIWKVQGIRDGNGSTGGGSSTYNDPQNNLRFIETISVEFAIDTFRFMYPNSVATSQKVDDTAKYYYGWITDDQHIVDRDVLDKRWRSLRNAINMMQLNKHEIYPSDIELTGAKRIIDKAEDFLKKVLEINLVKDE